MCRFIVICVFEYLLEKAMTLPFSKSATVDSDSKVRCKFAMRLKKKKKLLWVSSRFFGSKIDEGC